MAAAATSWGDDDGRGRTDDDVEAQPHTGVAETSPHGDEELPPLKRRRTEEGGQAVEQREAPMAYAGLAVPVEAVQHQHQEEDVVRQRLRHARCALCLRALCGHARRNPNQRTLVVANLAAPAARRPLRRTSRP
jgi:hypothetical protein